MPPTTRINLLQGLTVLLVVLPAMVHHAAAVTVQAGDEAALQAAVDDDTVDEVEVTGPITLTQGITIRRRLTVRGAGCSAEDDTTCTQTVDGGGSTHLFMVSMSGDSYTTSTDVNLTFANLKLQNGINYGTDSTYSTGGAVYFMSGEATFNSCVFSNNVADRGGAVFMSDETKATFNSCVFSNNIATIAEWNDGEGGAVYMSPPFPDGAGGLTADSVATFNSCKFSNNTAYEAGAVKVGGVATFNHCDFSNNNDLATAGHTGKVDDVYVTGSATFLGTTFLDCSGVYLSGSGSVSGAPMCSPPSPPPPPASASPPPPSPPPPSPEDDTDASLRLSSSKSGTNLPNVLVLGIVVGAVVAAL